MNPALTPPAAPERRRPHECDLSLVMGYCPHAPRPQASAVRQ